MERASTVAGLRRHRHWQRDIYRFLLMRLRTFGVACARSS